MVKLFIPITLIALTVLSDIHIYHRYINTTSMWRWCWWIPMGVLFVLLTKFLFFNKGLVEEYSTTNIFLLLLGLICIPKMLFALFSLIPKVGEYIGVAMGAGVICIVLWGITIGFTQFKVRHIVYESSDVPPAFDGYRIAQFSDAHTGVFRGPYAHLLSESIDSINAQQPDLICFVGDLENFVPSELAPHKEAFSRLKAKDGVLTIMGNHDYSSYVKVSDRERAELVSQTRQMQRSFGWEMLENQNKFIRRGNDSILVVGEENWGKPPFPQHGNLGKALSGIEHPDSFFTVMLSHDPTAWKEHILPVFHPNITLSGHTHGTQFSLFGWSPASMVYEEWGGEYHDSNFGKDLMLYVSTGFGGNFPFRFHMPREVVIITLKRSTNP